MLTAGSRFGSARAVCDSGRRSATTAHINVISLGQGVKEDGNLHAVSRLQPSQVAVPVG